MYTEKDISKYNLENIYEVFNLIEKYPLVFLSEPKIEELVGFINGYLIHFVHQPLNNNPWFEYEQFKYFIQQTDLSLWEKNKCNLIKIYLEKACDDSFIAYKLFWVDWIFFAKDKTLGQD